MSVFKDNVKNFGFLKNKFNAILAESILEKNNAKKESFAKYINLIKENEILKTQFLVYSNIENKIESDVNKATQFVKENIELFSKYNKKDIYEANLGLSKLISSEEELANDKKDLHENISKLIFTNKTPDAIDTIVESTNNIVNYILNNKPKVKSEIIDLPTSMLSTIMVDKYNEKYSTLDESEKKILKVLVDSSDEEKKEVYSQIIRECIDLINEQLNTDDLDTKDKLLKVKDKLLNDNKEINEDFVKNISKLMDLKNNLKEN